MNLFRLIILALAIWIAYRIWQNYRARVNQISSKQKTQNTIPEMVSCARCKMHIPETEAFTNGDKYYCSKQHLLEDS